MPTSTTTVKKQTEIKLDLSGVSGNGSGHNGGGGPNGGGNDGGDDDKRFSPSLYRIGMWVAIASIFMLFMALTGTYIMLVAGSSVWQTLKMPKLLWFSTALIIASSLTFELARQSLNDYKVLLYQKLLYITLALGLGFISIQIVVWQEIR
jgi:cytochrome c oxidase subunit III